MISAVNMLAGSLAVWRITHLLQAEDGPWALSARLRRIAGEGFAGQLLDCFYCLSLWVAIPVTLVLATTWRDGVLQWFALSAGAIAIQRILPAEITYREDPPEFSKE